MAPISGKRIFIITRHHLMKVTLKYKKMTKLHPTTQALAGACEGTQIHPLPPKRQAEKHSCIQQSCILEIPHNHETVSFPPIILLPHIYISIFRKHVHSSVQYR
jgi:hypothetical protein